MIVMGRLIYSFQLPFLSIYMPDIFEFGNPSRKSECDGDIIRSMLALLPYFSAKAGKMGARIIVFILEIIGFVFGFYFMRSRTLKVFSTEVKIVANELNRLSSNDT